MTTAPTPAPADEGPDGPAGRGRAPTGRFGWVVAASLAAGLLASLILVALPIVPARESEITGAVLCGFSLGWGLLAVLSTRLTDQPQRWAAVPAFFMGVGGILLLAFGSHAHDVLNWVWPPALLVLLTWVVVRVRRDLQGGSGRLMLHLVFGILAVASFGGGYETVREAVDAHASPMPGRLIDVGGHALHLNCTGSGSPTVVLEPGAGATSSAMARIAGDVARDTRVCVYDRAGRGWSEPVDTPQDGVTVATDLHTLLRRGDVPGPYVLAGHSFGGLYALVVADRYPDEVAGMVLVDSTAPAATAEPPAPSATADPYDAPGRVTALVSAAARLATVRDMKNTLDEYLLGGVLAQQAAAFDDFGDKPLVVVTAGSGHDDAELAAQDALSALSTNSAHVVVPGATHTSVIDEDSSTTVRAIGDVVSAVRTGGPLGR